MNPIFQRQLLTAVIAAGLLAGKALRTRAHPSGNPTLPRQWHVDDLVEDATAVVEAIEAKAEGDPSPSSLFDLVREVAALTPSKGLGCSLDLDKVDSLVASARVLVGAKEGGDHETP